MRGLLEPSSRRAGQRGLRAQRSALASHLCGACFVAAFILAHAAAALATPTPSTADPLHPRSSSLQCHNPRFPDAMAKREFFTAEYVKLYFNTVGDEITKVGALARSGGGVHERTRA